MRIDHVIYFQVLSMKNYSRKTNRRVTRYRTPSTFRIRQGIAVAAARMERPPKRGYV